MQKDVVRLTHVLLLALVLIPSLFAHAISSEEVRRWQQHSRNVTITRDDWGIAHVVGKTDADAVFGMIYAQAEDDFNRIETNYLNSLGRLAEAEGEAAIWTDLRQKLFIDPVELRKNYAMSPESLRKLMDAWADGLNYYLAKNPNVKPRVIKRFEPWMVLSFTEGSIGGDIESINLANLRAFYGGDMSAAATSDETDKLAEPTGSNGIAIAPKNTVGGKSLLLINPHTSFFFRSELQMTSREGLNAYGAVTWGQFFIYQGFNERLGWMHTSGSVDAIDEYREATIQKDGKYFYRHGSSERNVTVSVVKVPYKTAGGIAERTFTTYRTHHGPVIRREATSGKWITVSLMHNPVEALMQSYGRTKAKNYDEFNRLMRLEGNSSNNTIYADADGNIAYFHVNYVPRRDIKFDWTKPVDGSVIATDYKGRHTVLELPNLLNPATGWVYNTNNHPWSAAGSSSRKKADFPAYVDSGAENARGIHAIRLLKDTKDFTLESLNAAAYDSYLPWFEKTIPALIKAWEKLPVSNPLKNKLADQISALKGWDFRWSIDSVPTSLAVFWGDDVARRVGAAARQKGMYLEEYIWYLSDSGSIEQMLESLATASDKLTADFGKWNTPWGDINRFQRLTGDIVHPFDDSKPSIPVGFTSGNWGSLASFGARPFRGSKKWYGTSGNSFVAVVEFGPRVRARAVTAGGESGDPSSKHFNDQAGRYATGNLRDVYFYPSQLKGHTERVYRPGN
ncbi:MAG TPA: penicillin acylase family protein [Pyrinomonadaceae bacterium]|nr:penicillin acylase family protein [Pyrinomonadaceae bacterium]